ncbi:MAG TPA: sigma-70 family RNA polymerase sigma factor [Phycisphaerae bacterium]|nr:sigma-70 family RNA polymerase sigma factor [Phycisphaerae bacterium]HOB74962.1 sigma-70 family RNA polymerase sigma factor [Phycisphaerae bacterium]HOJ55753.1 sigma-70 family RNA polymerase sigma factor [Phycisphaerae bacterium]HOL25761.1 sigma-70 family RNA polymerase sigma factor [Phycisphaerae bacterium]HPP19546.1 sigma-70 family RNA polymerase sigma factor [Phycisphaerae bacterium]
MAVMNATENPTMETIVKRSRGVTPEVLPPTPEQLAALSEADRDLLNHILREPVEYTDHDLFQDPRAESMLFGEGTLEGTDTCFTEPAGSDPSRTPSGDKNTLSSAQEILLFQRFNYARMRQVELLQAYAGQQMPLEKLRELLAWSRRAMAARGQIAQANIPLVLAMAKRTRLNGLDFNELISEGNFALLRSVDKFDCSRGYKFSTYACRAILKSFSRVAIRTSRYRGRFPTEFDPTLEKSDFVDRKRDGIESDCVEELREILTENRASLNEIEQTVIRQRFALDECDPQAKPKTLEQVGEMIGVTKERVRQIQNKALQKIRSILEDNYLAA